MTKKGGKGGERWNPRKKIKESEIEKSKEKKKEGGKGKNTTLARTQDTSFSAFPLSVRLTRLVRDTHRDDKRGLAMRLCNIRAAGKKDAPLNVFIH